MIRLGASKIIIFEHLTVPSLIPALFFRMLGFKVVYLKISRTLKDNLVVKILHKSGIQIINYSRFRHYDVKQLYSTKATLAKWVYSGLISHEEELKAYAPLFGDFENTDRKVRIAAIDMIAMFLGNLPEVLICADYFWKFYDRVYIFSRTNPFVKLALAGGEYKVRNLYPPLIGYGGVLLKLFGRGLRFFKHRIRQLSRPSIKSKGMHEHIKAHQDLSAYKVLFFPHQGVAYGNLFLKDHYYSDDTRSPFHRKNIFHIEYESNLDHETYQNIVSFYEQNDIQYCWVPSISVATLLKALSLYFKHLMRINGLKAFLPPLGLTRHFLFIRLYMMYMNYYHFIIRFSNARLALVGYDILFPKPLSLALSSLGINTVAIEERFLPIFANNYIMMLDYYLVFGPIVQEHLQKREELYIGNAIPIGPVRLDILYGHYKKLRKNKHKKTGKIIIAYDYHSGRDAIDNNRGPEVNWRNNKAFYKDLIKLAVVLPNAYIIIRGKDDAWCSIPEFSDIYELISAMPNMEVNRDYSKYGISYELAATADLVIAKYSCIGEEALAAGIPVLFHDYSPNIEKGAASIFISDNYHYPVFIHSYKELLSRVERAINHSDYMDKDQFKEMREHFYGDSFDGKVKQRLLAELERIYCEVSS